MLASLTTVWLYGLGIPWPLDTKRDFGKTLRGHGARRTPKDDEIEPFYRATENETDAYLKALFAVVLSIGPRGANHIGKLTWQAVQFVDGKPRAIVADGAEYDFKTTAWLVAYLPPFASVALAAWRAQSKDTKDSAPIWPHR